LAVTVVTIVVLVALALSDERAEAQVWRDADAGKFNRVDGKLGAALDRINETHHLLGHAVAFQVLLAAVILSRWGAAETNKAGQEKQTS
jgi:hypothetical protein